MSPAPMFSRAAGKILTCLFSAVRFKDLFGLVPADARATLIYLHSREARIVHGQWFHANMPKKDKQLAKDGHPLPKGDKASLVDPVRSGKSRRAGWKAGQGIILLLPKAQAIDASVCTLRSNWRRSVIPGIAAVTYCFESAHWFGITHALLIILHPQVG